MAVASLNCRTHLLSLSWRGGGNHRLLSLTGSTPASIMRYVGLINRMSYAMLNLPARVSIVKKEEANKRINDN